MRSNPWNPRALAACLAVAPCLGGCGGTGAQNVARVTTPPRSPETAGVAMRSTAVARDASSLTDPEILAAVLRRIGRDAAIPAATITVDVEDGVATVRGTVDHLPAARRAVDAAARTRGVRGVVDAIDVRPAPRDDGALRADVEHALTSHAALGGLELVVDVAGGQVALAGTVRSLAEAGLVVDTVEGVRGVRSVASSLAVAASPPIPDDRIARAIQDRLRNDARLDAALVRVRVQDGSVRLEGPVASEAERRVAEELAGVPGVRSVDASGLRVEWWRREMMGGGPRDRDANVVAAIQGAIALDPRMSGDGVGVRVSDGQATLTGTVGSVAALEAAVEAAENVAGVVGVEHELQVAPDPQLADAEVDARVSETLATSPWLDEAIDVVVDDGRVVLRGTVDRAVEAEEARRLAAAIAGVRSIDDRIEVSAEALDEDWELASEVESSLGWNPYIGRMNVAVTVDDGVVTLRGSVDDRRAHREAEREAHAAGATEVRNELEIARPEIGAPRPGTPAPPP